MKKLLICIALLTAVSCEAQPNRPITVIDRIDRLNKTPVSNANPNIVMNPVVIPTAVANPNRTKVIFRGEVFDSQDRKPIANAKVSIGEYIASTDANGFFSIKDVPIGKYVFLVVKEDYIDFLDDTFELKETFGRASTYMKKKIKL